MFEGIQGSGKTSSARFLEQHGFSFSRGIPDGESLVRNTFSENWREAISSLQKNARQHLPVTMDRSIWSLVAFWMKTRPQSSDLIYRLGAEGFRRCVADRDYLLFFIDSKPEDCLKRNENKNTPLVLQSPSAYTEEHKTYAGLVSKLKGDGFKVSVISNGLSIAHLQQEISQAVLYG